MSFPLLIEVGSEEIPARMVADIARQFGAGLAAELRSARVLTDAGAFETYWTPRRLAVFAPALAESQPDSEDEVLGPPARVAFSADGTLTPQALGFAAKIGCEPGELHRAQTPKGEYVAGRRKTRGRPAAEILRQAIPAVVRGLDLPKSMQWTGRDGLRFIRPLRWLVVLLGGEVVDVELGDLTSDRLTRGHRTLGHAEIGVQTAVSLQQQLRDNFVLLSPEERRAGIEQGIAAALQGKGLRSRPDAQLLETLVNVTEFPSVIAGEFDPAYLDLPAEVLVTVMRDHQKYFAVESVPKGELAPMFLAVMDTDRDREGLIRHGHERVLRARFNDARFFWQTDLKRSLEQRREDLARVTFHAQLGNYLQKMQRVESLVEKLTAEASASLSDLNRGSAVQAARLCKSDLTTELVKEFTELQGIIGGLYAAREGLGPRVADAIYDQYLPLSVDGPIPRTSEGAVLAIADKLDSIVGMFAVGQVPSGSRDPFGLRRQGNGVVAILEQKRISVDIKGLVRHAAQKYKDQLKLAAVLNDTVGSVIEFLLERIEFYLREVKGVSHGEARAVLIPARDAHEVNGLHLIVRAVTLKRMREQQPENFARIANAFKRMRNILRQADPLGQFDIPSKDDFVEQLEHDLYALANRLEWDQLEANEEAYEKQYRQIANDWPDLLEAFFSNVRVDDKKHRKNRLNLLNDALERLERTADFSEIVVPGASAT